MESKFLVKSFGLNFISFIKIDYLPLLVFTSVVTVNPNWVSFLILCTSDIKDLVIGPVDELVILILEDLEPSRVGTPDLHVISFTSTLDIPRLIIISSSDSQGLLVEVPNLSLSSVSCLDDHISIVDKIKVSS
jgi:hypothetical protein